MQSKLPPRPRNLMRLTVWLASTSLVLSGAAPAWISPAWAQPAPPADAVAGGNGGDPPALAGRLSEVAGSVSTHGAGQTDWVAASVNTPVTNGDSFWTDAQASATVEVGSDHFVLNGATELDVAQLDQTQFVATEAQGEMFLDLNDLPDGQSLTINTPRAAVQITQTGQYDIVAGDSATPTSVTVISGGAHVTGTGVDLQVQAQQTATVQGDTQFQGDVGPAQIDDFARAQLRRGAPGQGQVAASVPAQVRYMTGGSDLARYGSWQSTSDYGQVWYPSNVAADWAPYRTGHWSYVGPWGWTWVDDEPWGFAPFHYGRWVSYGGRWGWVAAAPDAPPDAYPVYAPALVGFIGLGGVGLAIGAFGVGANIGWVPLGFREPYYPWYHVSDRYLQNVNRVSVVNVRNITINNYRNITVNHYLNERAATVVPAAAMVRGERLNSIARPLPAAELARARPVIGRLPVTPTAQTPGLNRIEARRFNVALPARPLGRVMPGPVIHPAAALAHPALRVAPAGERLREAVPHAPPHVEGGHVETPAIAGRPGLPPLRPANEAHVRPAPVAREARPGIAAAPRPGEARRPEQTTRPQAARPAAEARPVELHRPEAPTRPVAPRRVEPPRPVAPHVTRPAPEPETRHIAAPRPVEEHRAAVAPRPEIHHEAPRPPPPPPPHDDKKKPG